MSSLVITYRNTVDPTVKITETVKFDGYRPIFEVWRNDRAISHHRTLNAAKRRARDNICPPEGVRVIWISDDPCKS